ncbi:MAG: response regulator [Elusimicrobia bacterium]|nr:response regulator [Elusimicrobiota bacterium]
MSKKILIIEDEGLIAEVLSIRLQNAGYQTVTAFDGQEGWKKVNSEKPDLIILDIGLPIMDGNTLCGLIKSGKKTQKIPVIMLTGKKLVGDMEDSFRAGAEVYINKPYDWERLFDHIKKLLP